MYLLTSPLAEEICDTRWGKAAAAFGEAVAFELKERVFGPFAQSVRSVPPDDYWKRALARRAALGEMSNCLRQTRYPQNTIAKELDGWLQANQPRLREKIQKDQSQRLQRLGSLRGQGTHDHVSVTESDTREVWRLAMEWFEAMAGEAPAKSSSPS